MKFDEKEFFKEATLKICGTLDIEKALRECLLFFKNFLPVDEMNLHLYDRSQGAIITVAAADSNEGVFYRPPRKTKMPKEAMTDLNGPALPEVRFVNRPAADPVTRQMAGVHGRGDSSLLIMRLVIEGQRIGALTLRTDGADRYSDEHSRRLAMLNKPFAIALLNSLRYQEVLRLKEQLSDDNRYLQRELRQISGKEIIGSEFGLREVMEMVKQVAPLSSPVLLLGETGVGKEVIANAIHYSSPRKDGPFIKVNCGAITESLLDSELFGHEKGAFTGAVAQKRGRFERADRGTIFLDELGELPPNAQVRMLRVLQEKEIERVGGTSSIKVDIRVIAATNKNLEEMVRTGAFREDLWFRLNVFPLVVPPLRERKEDIPALVVHLIERKAGEMGIKRIPNPAPGVWDKLRDYSWPGNVRELENMVERAMIRWKGGDLFFDDLQTDLLKAPEPNRIETNEKPLSLDQSMARHIEEVLTICRGKVEGPQGAAQRLGINPSTLRNRMRKLHIRFGRPKAGEKTGPST
ncbi:MAG: sigma 54-interacting transcriptional regulator [Thermodesulfobacteriota bacterium]